MTPPPSASRCAQHVSDNGIRYRTCPLSVTALAVSAAAQGIVKEPPAGNDRQADSR
jgi:hypothetical protein